ncbi:MAG TPA: ATP-binding protein [Acidobacteriaceae bacterium]|nr:ATP-binding protein [Acidobacteriaceae bacterium]
MADLTRAFDWSRTSVGPIDQWPEALVMTVNTLLASRHPMFLWWGDDLVQFYNDGYRPSIREDKHPRALGQNGRDCWPEIWSIIGPQIDTVMTTGEATWHENQLVPINRNGKLEDVYWTYGYSPVRDAAGTICGTLVVCTETTQIVLANSQLQQERERLADLFQQAPAFFAVLRGPSHVFEMANPPYQELIGQRDILGRALAEAVPESMEQGFVALLDTVYRTGAPYIGRNTPIELMRTAAQPPELRYLDFVYQPRRDADGTISGIIVLGVDVTENRRVEGALLQSEKLAAVGRLASSIAHEINNPLEAVTNLIYLAQHSAVKPEVRDYLNTAEAELRRVSGIARQTLRFYRQSTNATPVAMADLIGDTLPLYQGRLTNARIHLERRDRSRLSVTCFEGEIRQVLSNLLGNAIDAVGSHGGRILIRSREATHWASGRRGVVLTVADTGSGISRTTLAKIFDPFFTTKGASGTGLGLWISRQIVERHHGDLRVRSSQAPHSRGTVFTLFLPADDDLTA